MTSYAIGLFQPPSALNFPPPLCLKLPQQTPALPTTHFPHFVKRSTHLHQHKPPSTTTTSAQSCPVPLPHTPPHRRARPLTPPIAQIPTILYRNTSPSPNHNKTSQPPDRRNSPMPAVVSPGPNYSTCKPVFTTHDRPRILAAEGFA